MKTHYYWAVSCPHHRADYAYATDDVTKVTCRKCISSQIKVSLENVDWAKEWLDRWERQEIRVLREEI